MNEFRRSRPDTTQPKRKKSSTKVSPTGTDNMDESASILSAEGIAAQTSDVGAAESVDTSAASIVQQNAGQKRTPLSPSNSTRTDEGSGPKKKRKILLCQIIGCPRQVSSKGYCKPHLDNPDLIVTKPIRDEDAKYERYTGPGKRGPKVKNDKKGHAKKRPDPFPIYFPKLVQYKEKHGNLRVPRSEKELFNFMESCRHKYSLVQEGKKSRILSSERIEQLNSIGFDWVRLVDDEWEENFRMLVDYRNQHGHCRVNTRTDGCLSNFVKKTRTNYSQQMAAKEKGTLTPDRTRTLTPDRIQRLNEMGFEWRVWTQDPWEKRFHEIQDFHSEHGHFNVKFGENQTLSSWVKTQRTGYRNFMAALRADNDRKMAARRNPNGNAPLGMDEAYEKLAKKRPMIDADRIVKLQMIGFEWNVQENLNETAWEKHFIELMEFKAEFGHTRVSRNYQENLQLGTWVKMQRRAMTKKIKGQGGDSLSEERMRRLDDIGFEWRLKPLEMDEHEVSRT